MFYCHMTNHEVLPWLLKACNSCGIHYKQMVENDWQRLKVKVRSLKCCTLFMQQYVVIVWHFNYTRVQYSHTHCC